MSWGWQDHKNSVYETLETQPMEWFVPARQIQKFKKKKKKKASMNDAYKLDLEACVGHQ